MELFKLLGTVAVDGSAARKEIESTTATAESSRSKIGSAFEKIGSAAATMGKAVAAGLAVGTTAMTALTVKALNLSGELEQNLGGSEAVFGEHAAKLQETAQEAFSNMGLATSDYLATANKMGALFQGAGYDIEESMNISTAAMQRAADVASIMGIDTASAMEAVAGAAKGNFTMMDNLGVAMNETSLAAYALEKGYETTYEQMSQQEKIGVAMEMFLDKTAYAAGNYAKENETLAGSLGTAKSAMKNFLDGSGDVDAVVDSFTKAADVIVTNIDKLLPKLTNGITKLVKKLTPKLPKVLQKLLPGIVNGAKELMEGLVKEFPAIVTLVTDMLPFVLEGIVSIMGSIVSSLPKMIEPLVKSLPSILSSVLKQLVALLPTIINGLVDVFLLIVANISQIIEPIIDVLPDIITTLIDALMDNLPALIEGCVMLVVALVQAMPQIILSLLEAIPSVVASIVEGLWNALPILLTGVIEMVGTVGVSFWETVKGVFETIGEFFGGVVTAISEAFSPVTEFFSGIWEGIKEVFAPVTEWFETTFGGAMDAVDAKLREAWNKTADWLNEKFGWAIGKLDEVRKNADGTTTTISYESDGSRKESTKVNETTTKTVSYDADGNVTFQGSTHKISQVHQRAKGGVLEKGEIAFLEGTGAEAVVPLEKNTEWINKTAEKMNRALGTGNDSIIETKMNEMVSLQKKLLTALENLKIYLDTDALVGGLTPALDASMGDLYSRKGRA